MKITDEELIAKLRKMVDEVQRHEQNNTRNAGTDTNCRWFLCEHGDTLIERLASHEPTPEPAKDGPEVVAWVIPGRDNANCDGFIDALAWEEGEFSKPLVALSDYEALRVKCDEYVDDVKEVGELLTKTRKVAKSLLKESDKRIADLKELLRNTLTAGLPDEVAAPIRTALKGQSNE